MKMQTLTSTFAAALLLAAAPAGAHAATLFVRSAVENGDGTVTLPLHAGTSRGRPVFYVILDSSSGADADAKRVNHSQKLANARDSGAVQRVTMVNGAVEFPATVNFRAGVRVVELGPGARSSAVGEDGYSPIIQLPDGTIENAPHVASDVGTGLAFAPKVKFIDLAAMTVTLEETAGFQGGNPVRYVSTDASDMVAAALEDVTFAPRLNAAPALDDDSTHSSRTSLAAFVNGQTGAANPQRQGLNSAIADGLSPLNILRWNPSQGRYSPLWDVHLAAWSETAISAGANLRQTDYGDVVGLASHGVVTAPDGTPFAAAGFIVNCPIVSQQ